MGWASDVCVRVLHEMKHFSILSLKNKKIPNVYVYISKIFMRLVHIAHKNQYKGGLILLVVLHNCNVLYRHRLHLTTLSCDTFSDIIPEYKVLKRQEMEWNYFDISFTTSEQMILVLFIQVTLVMEFVPISEISIKSRFKHFGVISTFESLNMIYTMYLSCINVLTISRSKFFRLFP